MNDNTTELQQLEKAGVFRGRLGYNDRMCYPPGHEVTWGLITKGTILEGLPYPHPVFDVSGRRI